MSEIKENFNSDWMSKFIDFYTKDGFGRVLKADIDVYVFDYIIKNEFKISDYKMIIKSQIYDISRKLKITENRVISLIEKASLIFEEYDEAIEDSLIKYIEKVNENLKIEDFM